MKKLFWVIVVMVMVAGSAYGIKKIMAPPTGLRMVVTGGGGANGHINK